MADREYRSGFDWGRLRLVGLLLVALLLLAYGVYKAGQVLDVFAERYELVTLLSSASGLRVGAPVTLAGQRVGQVEEIEFIPVERQRAGNHLTLSLSVSTDVRQQIRADSRAQVKTQGLLGDKLLEITPGTATAPVLASGDTLPADPPIDYEEVLSRAAGMLDEAEIVLENLQTLTGSIARGEGVLGRLLTDDALYDRVMLTTTELTRTLHEINVSEGTIGRLLRDPALYDRLNATLAQLESLSTDLAGGEGTLGRLVQNDSLYDALVGTVVRADSVLASLDSTATLMSRGDGTLARLLNDPAMYDELLRSIVELQTLLQDIRANPDAYRPYVDVF